MAYKDTILAAKPLGYFRFDEISGSIITSIISGASFDIGSIDGGEITYGVNGLIDDPNTAMHLLNSSARGIFPFDYSEPLSLEGWFLSDPIISNEAVIFSNFTNINDWSFILQAINFGGQLTLLVNAVGGIVNIPAQGVIFNDGTVHHFVITYDGSTVILYVNGVVRGTATNVVIIDSILDNISIANDYNPTIASAFNGVVDELSIFNYPLTQSQVTEHYNVGINPPVPVFSYADIIKARGPSVYYRLGEAAGETVAVDEINNNDANYIGAVTLETPGLIVGDDDTCITLPGNSVGDRVSLPVIAETLPTNQLTVEAWVSVSAADGSIAGAWSGNNTEGNGYLLSVDDNGFLRFYVGTVAGNNNNVAGAAYLIAPLPITFGQTLHVVGTYRSGSRILYINGQPVVADGKTGEIDYAVISGLLPAPYIGAQGFAGILDKPLNATVDELAIYSRALSPAAILDNYNAGIQPPVADVGGVFASIINVRST